MIQPRLLVSIGSVVLDMKDVVSFEYLCSRDEDYPKAILKIRDDAGTKLSQFYGLAIGTSMRVAVVDPVIASASKATKADSEMKFCELKIASIGTVFTDANKLSGILQILAVHPWAFFKDFTSKVYQGKPNSEYIKTIMKSDARGWAFDVDESYIDSSDEDGIQPRYKTYESDFDFIKNKLLPNTLISKNPPIFWIDELNRPRLTTFSNMFQNEYSSVAVLQSVASSYSETLSQLTSKCEGHLFLYESLTARIGNEDYNLLSSSLKYAFMIDPNAASGGTIEGLFSPQLAISTASGNNIGDRLPYAIEYLNGVDQTDRIISRNKTSKDAFSSLKQSMAPSYDTFQLDIEGPFAGNIVKTGENIYLYFPAMSSDGKIKETGNTKYHWIQDKWNVKSVRHYLDKENEMMRSHITVCRPSFLYNSSNTTILMPALLAKGSGA